MLTEPWPHFFGPVLHKVHAHAALFSEEQEPLAAGGDIKIAYRRPCEVRPVPELFGSSSLEGRSGRHRHPFQYLFLSGTSFSAPAVSGIVALMLEKNKSLNNADADFGTLEDPTSWGPGYLEFLLEMAAIDIPADSVVTTFRTGVPDTECWEMGTAGCTLEATGAGWVFVDYALAAVP